MDPFVTEFVFLLLNTMQGNDALTRRTLKNHVVEMSCPLYGLGYAKIRKNIEWAKGCVYKNRAAHRDGLHRCAA